MTEVRCLTDDQLRAFVSGTTDDKLDSLIEHHLSRCGECVRRTRAVEPSDPLLLSIKAGWTLNRSIAEHVFANELIAKLKNRSSIETVVIAAEVTASAAKPDLTDTVEILTRFAPTDVEGELGRLGCFRIQQLLGRGGMGAVFQAVDESLDRFVALKVLLRRHAEHKTARDRFLREAKAMAAVRHDHVVTVYQVGEFDGVQFIAQELLVGATLDSHLLDGSRFSVAETVRIAGEIARGLAAAHAKGLIHRDVKPSNLWLEEKTGRVKILDFGLALPQSLGPQLPQTGAIIGTPAYMSPEQAEGLALDVRSDLFSLGVVLYRMLTGRLPFSGTDTRSQLRSLAIESPVSAGQLNSEIPRSLSALIDRLLSKDRDQRPADAMSVAIALEEVVKHTVTTQIPIVVKLPAQSMRRKSIALLIVIMATLASLAAAVITLQEQSGPINTVTADTPLGSKLHVDIPPEVPPASPLSDWRSLPGAPYPTSHPCSAVIAKQDQRAWSQFLNVSETMTNTLGMSLHIIPPGDANLGMTKQELSEYEQWIRGSPDHANLLPQIAFQQPQRRVRTSQPFFLAETEVTQGQFQQFLDATGQDEKNRDSEAPARRDEHLADMPVHSVSPGQAIEFCRWLSDKEGVTYRLPTRDEWEYATRAGSPYRYLYCQNLADLPQFLPDFPSHSNRAAHEAPQSVGQSATNAYGLRNVFVAGTGEWCSRESLDSGSVRSHYERPDYVCMGWPLGMAQGSVGLQRLPVAKPADLRHPLIGFRILREVPPLFLLDHPPLSPWEFDSTSPDHAPDTFTPQEAATLQQNWASFLQTEIVCQNSQGMHFSLVPPGEFEIGITDQEVEEYERYEKGKYQLMMVPHQLPRRWARLTRPVFFGQTEVTVSQFAEFVKATEYVTKAETDGLDSLYITPKWKVIRGTKHNWKTLLERQPHPQEPVTLLAREDMEDFCRWLSEREGIRYRLPTETEWTFAVRAGMPRDSFAPRDMARVEEEAWYLHAPRGDAPKNTEVLPVGLKRPNAFGLYDGLGNVFEVCLADQPGRLRGIQKSFAEWAIVEKGHRAHDPQNWHSAETRFPICEHPDYLTPRINTRGFRIVREVRPFARHLNPPQR